MNNRKRTAAERAELVARWRASGKTAREFGARHGVKSTALYAWSKVASRSAAPAFVEVQVAAGALTEAPAVEVLLAGGRVVRVREVVDPRVLRSVVEALESC